MDEQLQRDDSKDRNAVVQSSIKKLKDKFVPGVKYTLIIAAVFNLSMLVIGCLNVHKCPVSKEIPLFLIATGALGLMSKFVSYLRDRISTRVRVVYIESALYSVETIFFLLGTYWVYKEFQPNYNPNSGSLYCNKTAYLFAFIYITVYYAIVVAILCGFCCFLCCACFLAAVPSGNEDPESNPTTEVTVSTATTTTSKDVETKP